MYKGKLIQIRKESENLYIVRIRKSGSYFMANKTSVYILKMADEGVPIKEIPNILVEVYNISIQTARMYVKALVQLVKNIQSYSLNIDLKTPLRVSWKLTSQCNLKCKHCYSSCSPSEKEQITYSEMLKVIDKLECAEIFDVSITGGEIFTLKEIKNIISTLIEKKFDVSIFSNATLILKNKNWLFKLPIRKYNISLDGLQNSHDFIRGEGNFDKVWKCIMELKKQGCFILVNCVINSININELSQIHDLLFENNIEYQFTLMLPLGRGSENIDLLPDSESYLNGIAKLQEKLISNGEKGTLVNAIERKIIEVYNEGYVCKVEDDWACNAGNTKFDINWDGSVFSCPMCSESYLGNILDLDVKQLWSNQNRINFIKNKKKAVGHFCIPVRETINKNEIAREKMHSFLGYDLITQECEL